MGAASRNSGTRRPRVVVTAISVAVLFSIALIAAPTVFGGRSDIVRKQLGRLELPPTHAGHPPATAAAVKAVLRADRKRAIRCRTEAYRRFRVGGCPANLRTVRRRGAARVTDLSVGNAGAWSSPVALPVLGIHSVLLPTGKVLFFAYPNGDKSLNEGTAWLWNPADDSRRRVDPPPGPNGKPANIWCAGQALLADGTVLVAGGNLEYQKSTAANNSWKGLNMLFTFNPWTETWTVQPSMRKGRWYPSVTVLPDGRAVILGGWDEAGNEVTDQDIEVFTPSSTPGGVGTLARVGTIPDYTGLYPHVFATPDGKLLAAGPGRGDSWILDPADWDLTYIPQLPSGRDWSSALIMPAPPAGPQSLAIFGGYSSTSTTKLATRESLVIDLANPAAGWQQGPAMNTARQNFNVVILPDGSLSAIGGSGGWVNGLYDSPIYESEILEPQTGAWRTTANQSDERTYHSTALLLPDASVLSAGDDRPGHQVGDTYEIFSPPYFARGSRPVIASAGASVAYGGQLTLETPDASRIAKYVLLAPGATTHGSNMSQRSIELAAQAAGSTVTLTAPARAELATPGYYMLFAVSTDGVPSMARWVRLGGAVPANRPPIAAFDAVPASPVANQLVTFSDRSSDPDGQITTERWDLNDDGAFDDATGPTATATFAKGARRVSLEVVDDRGAVARTSTTLTVTDPPPPPPPPGNLLTNPSFEVNLSGWVGWQSTLARVAVSGAPDGGYVAAVTRKTGTSFTVDDGPDTVRGTLPGRKYTATAWVRTVSSLSAGKPLTLYLRERSSAGATVGGSSAAVILDNTWKKVTVTATTVSSDGNLDVYAAQGGAGAGSAFQIDALRLASPE